ncbi:hypothetical protein [Cellulomonas massiliensis]|uniref:hypothetical protein n=1 Tax=Cellulomonas massiliensis TaxID=1465811 RepID=UPI0003732144|nr:hypothetical protein [Cellulomonas massiliensis]
MVRYAERSPKRRTWLVFLGVCVVAWVGFLVADGGNPAFGTILVGMLGGITALAMWSTGVYGNVTLTETELRSGRARIPLADVQPWGVAPKGAPPVGRLVGGAFAETMGKGVLGLTLRSGEQVLVQTSDPDALRTALETALAPYRHA